MIGVILALLMIVAGGVVTLSNTRSRFGPTVLVAGLVILLLKLV